VSAVLLLFVSQAESHRDVDLMEWKRALMCGCALL